MRVYSRLRRLERKYQDQSKKWAVFTLNYYTNPKEGMAAKERLINNFQAGGNSATHYLFINEVPCSGAPVSEEKYLYSFTKPS